MSLMESDRKRIALIDTAREFINRTATLAMDHFEEPEIETQLAELRKTVLKYCKSDILYKIESEILQEMDGIIADYPNNLEDLSFDEVLAKLRKKKHKNLEEDKLKEHQWYKEFEHKISTLRSQATAPETEEEEDFVPTEIVKSYIDPFTKQTMQQPMKNKRCGHSYDRVAVISMLKHKKSLRCPYTLCNALVVEKDLEENVDLLNEIKESQRS